MPFLTKSRRSSVSKTVESEKKQEISSLLNVETAEKDRDLYNDLVKELKQKQELLRRLNLVKAYKSRVGNNFRIFLFLKIRLI